MTALDAAVIIIALILLIRGIWVGFIRQIASIAALILGFVAAGRYYEQFAGYTGRFIDSPQIGFLITYTVLFLLVYLLVVALGFGLKKVMSLTLLGWFDRTMGGFFGLGKAVLIMTVFFMILSGLLSSSNTLLTNSFFAPHLSTSAAYLLHFIQDTELRSRFLPKEPAIPSLPELPAAAFKRDVSR